MSETGGESGAAAGSKLAEALGASQIRERCKHVSNRPSADEELLVVA
jgi:hypothetical protein